MSEYHAIKIIKDSGLSVEQLEKATEMAKEIKENVAEFQAFLSVSGLELGSNEELEKLIKPNPSKRTLWSQLFDLYMSFDHARNLLTKQNEKP